MRDGKRFSFFLLRCSPSIVHVLHQFSVVLFLSLHHFESCSFLLSSFLSVVSHRLTLSFVTTPYSDSSSGRHLTGQGCSGRRGSGPHLQDGRPSEASRHLVRPLNEESQ